MNKRMLLIGLIGLILSGCASARVLFRGMPIETSKSALVQQGPFYAKKPIVGIGWEAIVYGEIILKVTNKDGSVVEIKTMKSSLLEKMLGWTAVLKPNSVGVGK